MARKFSAILCLVGLTYLGLPQEAKAQMPEEDRTQFDTSLRWLETNLAYVYQNESTGEWWNNNFFYNPKTGEINIKNASSDVPNATDKKVYFNRIVNLRDLDITSLKLDMVWDDKGRIVKGQVLHIDAIGKEQRIQKLYNGRPSFKEFFLQVSFPATNDSVAAKAELCKKHFETILRLGTKVYPEADSLSNTNNFFELIPGTYKGSNQTSCVVEEIFPHSLELQFFRGEKLYKKSVISYDESNHHFIYWMVNVAGSSHFELNFHFEEVLQLQADAENYLLTFPSSHAFSIKDGGQTINYNRSGF